MKCNGRKIYLQLFVLCFSGCIFLFFESNQPTKHDFDSSDDWIPIGHAIIWKLIFGLLLDSVKFRSTQNGMKKGMVMIMDGKIETTQPWLDDKLTEVLILKSTFALLFLVFFCFVLRQQLNRVVILHSTLRKIDVCGFAGRRTTPAQVIRSMYSAASRRMSKILKHLCVEPQYCIEEDAIYAFFQFFIFSTEYFACKFSWFGKREMRWDRSSYWKRMDKKFTDMVSTRSDAFKNKRT